MYRLYPVKIRNLSNKVVKEMKTDKMSRNIIKNKFSLDDLLNEGEKLIISDTIKLNNNFYIRDMKAKKQNFSIQVIFLNYPSDSICRVKIAINKFKKI